MSKQDFRTPNPIEIQKNLKGIRYPAQKDEIVRTARNNDAEDWVMRALERLPNQTFEAPTDVNAALSNAH